MIEKTPQGTTKATASKAAQRKRLKKMHVSQAEGGYVVKHHYHPEHGGTPKPDSHVFESYEDTHAHVERTMRGHK